MAKQMQRRILRNYRNVAPSRFHALNQRVRKSLSESNKIPEFIWAANQTLVSSYFAASDKHDAVYHEATYGSRLVIAEREVLQSQIIDYLDDSFRSRSGCCAQSGHTSRLGIRSRQRTEEPHQDEPSRKRSQPIQSRSRHNL